MINIGIIGYGYWGPNLVRNFAETPGATVSAVADLDTHKLEAMQRRYPAVKTTTAFMDLITDPDIAAVAKVSRIESQARDRGKGVSVA